MNTTRDHTSPKSHRCRRDSVAFLISAAMKLETPPVTKYSALSLFADRFLPSLTSHNHRHRHWLLQTPLSHSTLQLFSLTSLWISSKIHGSPVLPLKSLKSIGDDQIKDQHFTKTDYLHAEKLFLELINFDIGTLKNSVFRIVDELFMEFREVAKVGELMSFDACFDVLDLMYENEEISRLLVENPVCVAAGIVVASFVATVPKQSSEFPVIGWVKFVTCCVEKDVIWIVKLILEHIVEPSRSRFSN